jgi:hypothetical protein
MTERERIQKVIDETKKMLSAVAEQIEDATLRFEFWVELFQFTDRKSDELIDDDVIWGEEDELDVD